MIRYEIDEQFELGIKYSTKKWNISKPTFLKATNELTEYGFIEKVFAGGNGKGVKSVYALVNSWKHRESSRSYVYVIKCDKFHKIGIAKDVKKRIKEMETGNPFKMCLLLQNSYYNSSLHERKLHDIFKDKRVNGEWFDLSDNDILKIVEYFRKTS